MSRGEGVQGIDQRHPDKCSTCVSSGSDPDGAFCGHPKSFEGGNIYGQGVTLARSEKGVCGPGAKLYMRCTCADKHCPRHARGEKR